MFTNESTIVDDKETIEKLIRKQQILFACDCSRTLLRKWEDDSYINQLRELLNTTESFAKKEFNFIDFRSNCLSLSRFKGKRIEQAISSVEHCCNCILLDDRVRGVINSVINSIYNTYIFSKSWKPINNIYRNAYNDGKEFPEYWKTRDVLDVSQAIIIERDFASCPILADALEDANCTDKVLLNHLRTDTIGLSDWAIFNLRQDI